MTDGIESRSVEYVSPHIPYAHVSTFVDSGASCFVGGRGGGGTHGDHTDEKRPSHQ